MRVTAVAAVLAGAALALLRRRYLVVTIRGSSLHRTYADADRVLVRRSGTVAPHRGDVVVLHAPTEFGLLLVKRVAAVPGDEVPPDFRPAVALPVVPPGRLLLLGDTDNSVDSRRLGLIDTGLVVGTVVGQSRHSAASRP